MSSQLITIIKNILDNKTDIKPLEKICDLCEKLRLSYTLSEMGHNIFQWLHQNYSIKDFTFILHNSLTNHQEIIIKKGKEFYLDDMFTHYFIIDTKTEFNAIISFKAIDQKYFEKVTQDHQYLHTLFLQISPVLQSGILKKIHLESASRDTVTHLHNRQYLLEYIDSSLKFSCEKKDEITFLVIGIDRFKAIIDEFDYDTGDKVLIELAKVIHRNIKQTDIVARLIGDEFLVALLHISERNRVENIVKRLINEFAKSSVVVNKETQQKLKKTICIGISSYPKDSEDIDQVIKNADQFLYLAKETKRGSYAFYHDEENTIEFF